MPLVILSGGFLLFRWKDTDQIFPIAEEETCLVRALFLRQLSTGLFHHFTVLTLPDRHCGTFQVHLTHEILEIDMKLPVLAQFATGQTTATTHLSTEIVAVLDIRCRTSKTVVISVQRSTKHLR